LEEQDLLKDTVQVNRDVLIQLLEALEAVYGDSCDAIHALRAALADQPQTTHWQGCEEVHPECAARARVVEYPVQEPVAWTVVGDGKFGEYKLGKNFETSDPPNFKYWKNRGYELAPLYTAPPQRKPLTEEYRPKSWSELEQQYQAGCDHCTHPQYCGIRCSVCGRWTDK
jgi:hypothetical protein